jgi:hypothetical protein
LRTDTTGKSLSGRLRPWLDWTAAVGAVLAAIFTWWQVQVTKDTEKRQLRAYVWIAPGEIEGFKVGQVPRIPVTIRNGGATPAYLTGTLLALRRESAPQPGQHVSLQTNFPPLQPLSEGRGDFIFQDHTLTLLVPNLAPLDQLTVDRVQQGEWAVYVFGRVNYKDVFDAVHFVEFCYYWTGGKPPGQCEGGDKVDHND